MYTSQILNNKANGKTLSSEEIEEFIKNLCAGKVAEAQIGAFLMAVFTRGMNAEECANLTGAMKKHSQQMTWSDKEWANVVVDKHSTGGVGDKTSHILAPMIVACGGKVPMISGRGLGTTGGTIDKLESIKGYSASQNQAKLLTLMNDPGFFIVGQTEKLVPADRQLYKFRDVTGTVASVPLITSSILSKKLCEGLCGLVMDIKLGSGALFQDTNQVIELAESLVSVGKVLQLKVIAVISWMDEPLGNCIGNALEMAEVFSILAGEPLTGRMGDLILSLGTNMLATTALKIENEKLRETLLESLTNSKAQLAMQKMLIGQGVNRNLATKLCTPPPKDCPDSIDYYIKLMGKMPVGKTDVKSKVKGYVTKIDAGLIAEVVWRLGAGRDKPGEKINHTVGIRLYKHVGDQIDLDETWCTIYHKEKTVVEDLHQSVCSTITISNDKPDKVDVVYKIIQ